VTLRGQTFRFINTHLEQEGPFSPIQVAQGNELLSGPANTSLPVILIGDFNSRADGTGTQTYGNLIGAGFKDAWSATHPGELGNTWGHEANLLNTTVNLTQRLDLVLFRNTSSVTPNLCALDADVVGDELSDRTPSGLWPSDHAGVVGTLRSD
jgi:endonuclease/exonuclease/phosphatase family metal-dependent hydrolase